MSDEKASRNTGVFGFLAGFFLMGSISFGFNLYRSRLYRQDIARLSSEIELSGKRLERYSAEIADERRRVVECRRTVEEGLSDCQSIGDATARIRRQVEILAKYYSDTGDCVRSGKSSSCLLDELGD